MSRQLFTGWLGLIVLCLPVCLIHVSSVRADDEAHVSAAYESGHEGHEAYEAHEHDGGALIEWFGRFHPIVVHFPIALLSAALLAEFFFVLTGSERFEPAGRFCLILGALSAVLAALLGWCWEGFHLIDDGSWRSLETLHRWSGTLTAVCSLGLLLLCPAAFRPGARVTRRLYRACLLITVGLLGYAGYLGGSMVWGVDHLAW